MTSIVHRDHPIGVPTQESSLLINLTGLKNATSTQVAELLGISPLLFSKFLKQLPHTAYTDRANGSKRLIQLTEKGALEIIKIRDSYNAQRNKQRIKKEKKNKPEQYVSYTEFMRGMGNFRSLVYRTAWSETQKSHPQFFTKIGRTLTLKSDFYKEALGEFNKHLTKIEAQKGASVKISTGKKAQRRILHPNKYASDIIRQAGDRL